MTETVEMTTPRDAIADLIKELRWPRNIRSPDDLPEQVRLRQAAATALDALQARVKELEADRDRWKRHAQDETETAVAVHSELRTKLSRAEQQRDEAYERAAKVAEGPLYKEKWRGCEDHNWWHEKQPPGSMHDYGNGRHDAAAAIRRLAAGTEKGKR